MERYAIAIVGAGIAGASLAAELAGSGRVVLLEAEAQPGYHTTGRSAAFWTESYGGAPIQPLTTASEPYLHDGGFLTARGALTIGTASSEVAIDAFVAEFSSLGVRIERLDRSAVEAMVPGVLPQWTAGALERSCCDIDVAALHQHCLRLAKRGGVQVLTDARLASAQSGSTGWRLGLADGRSLACDVVVDAAGAWADPVAQICGIAPLGIAPLRRTIAQVRVDPPAPSSLPLVLDIDDRFYFKPDAGRLWLSPQDETPSLPCDAAPEEIDVATAIERLGNVVDWRVEAVEHRWAGLRSFAPDRLPVYGFDPGNPRFFWFAGQGGFGIQTAPAAASLAARLIRGETGGEIDPQPYSAARFR